ncbi:MAG: hypothetical protein ACKVZ6_04880 [Kineosporiaceae bacterium]
MRDPAQQPRRPCAGGGIGPVRTIGLVDAGMVDTDGAVGALGTVIGVVAVDLGMLVRQLLRQSFPVQEEGLRLSPGPLQVTPGASRGQPARERPQQHAQPEHRHGTDDNPVQEQLPYRKAGQVQSGDTEVGAQRVRRTHVRQDTAHRGQARENEDQEAQDGDQCQHLRVLTGVSPQ